MKFFEYSNNHGYNKLRDILMAINPNNADKVRLIDLCKYFSEEEISKFADFLKAEYDIDEEDLLY